LFCNNCGGSTISKIPSDDNKLRDICSLCGHIHYINPKIIVGVLPVKADQILLCKRDIDPAFGKWTVPSGFMEIGESLEEGAKREAFEEANLRVRLMNLFCTYSLPHIGQVYMLYLGQIINNDFKAMDETSEVRLYDFDDIPWDAIAFSSVEFTLKKYIDDYKNNQIFGFYSNFE